MKKYIGVLAACLMALPFTLSAQNYTAQSGVSLLTGVTAAATPTSGAVRLPTFGGTGTLNITESGITGSPSGCTVALSYQQNNATVKTAAVATISFTPATGTPFGICAIERSASIPPSFEDTGTPMTGLSL